MALGKLLEGAAWLAALSLATVGVLAFVPDGAWEAFPSALRPARAKLADFGVAPTCYRVDASGSDGGESDKVGANDKNGVGDWSTAAEVRIGERWRKERNVRPAVSGERETTPSVDVATSLEDASEIGAIVDAPWNADAIPPFVENVENVDASGVETAFGGDETSTLPGANGWGGGTENPGNAENLEVATLVDETG
ncbi:MAG: hypothetical protein IJO46_03470, partial [Thermoguttaceae bacterium]|nr:hypothetical protein [Thermoguttaceae bacterium]